MADDLLDVVHKRRKLWEAGRGVCIACGSASAADRIAEQAYPYRILRGGMYVGDLSLTSMDQICRFCEASGQVKP